MESPSAYNVSNLLVFLVMCANWFENRSRLQPHNLAEDYSRVLNITPEKLERGFSALSDSVAVVLAWICSLTTKVGLVVTHDEMHLL